MKVIENRFVAEWPKNIECGKCKSSLEYDKADIVATKRSDYDRNEQYYYMSDEITCPCCGYENVLATRTK